MKNFLLIIITYLSVISCTTESELDKAHFKSITGDEVLNLGNNANLYDSIGQKYYEVINLYYEEKGLPENMEELTLQLQAVDAIIKKVYPEEIIISEVSNSKVLDIIKNPEMQLRQIVEIHSVSSIAKTKLLELSHLLLNRYKYKDFKLRDKIVAYEAKIIKNERMNQEDKKVILSISSISRYIFLTELDRKDRDWEKSKTGKKSNNIFDDNQISIVNFIVAVNSLIVKS